jgi:hypothetical protein
MAASAVGLVALARRRSPWQGIIQVQGDASLSGGPGEHYVTNDVAVGW